MKSIRTPLTLAAALALLGASTLAQAQSSSSQSQSTQQPQSSYSSQNQSAQSQSSQSRSQKEISPGTEASKDQLKVEQNELQNDVTDANKASKIIGKEVRNTENDRVGKVKDLVIDVNSGKIAYAVLSTGGMLGGGKLIAVPLDALSLKPGEKHFIIDAAKDRLAAAPGFSEDNWPKLNAAEGDKTIGLSASTDESTQQKAQEENKDKNSTQGTDSQKQEQRPKPDMGGETGKDTHPPEKR